MMGVDGCRLSCSGSSVVANERRFLSGKDDGVPNGMRWLLQPVHHRNRTECRDFRSPFRNAGKKINMSAVKTSNEPIDEGRLWYSLLFHQFYPSILRPPFLCLI